MELKSFIVSYLSIFLTIAGTCCVLELFRFLNRKNLFQRMLIYAGILVGSFCYLALATYFQFLTISNSIIITFLCLGAACSITLTCLYFLHQQLYTKQC